MQRKKKKRAVAHTGQTTVNKDVSPNWIQASEVIPSYSHTQSLLWNMEERGELCKHCSKGDSFEEVKIKAHECQLSVEDTKTWSLRSQRSANVFLNANVCLSCALSLSTMYCSYKKWTGVNKKHTNSSLEEIYSSFYRVTDKSLWYPVPFFCACVLSVRPCEYNTVNLTCMVRD